MSVIAIVLLPIALQVGSAAAHDSASAATDSSAYLDAGAAEMVRRARVRIESDNRLIGSYRVVAREHESVRVRAFDRDRLAFRRDRVARIEWKRSGPAHVELLGSREVTPLISNDAGTGSDGDLSSGGADLVFEPDREWILRTPADGGGDDGGAFVHPLAPGSEGHYRFRSGSPTTIRMPEGTEVRLIELQIVPRRSDHRLVSGSLWLTADGFATVRGAFRFSVPVAFGIYTEDRAWGASGEFRLFLFEYGLWQGRWWLPRLFAFEGSATVGSMAAAYRKEIRYEGYDVFSGTAGALESPVPGNEVMSGSPFDVLTDSADACDGNGRLEPGVCREYRILVPRDRSRLISSEELPPTPFDPDEALLSEAEIRRGVAALYSSGVLSDLLPAPGFRWRWLDPSLLHFNRVEGATIGTSASLELANLRFTGAAWLGLADRAANFDAAVTRDRYTGSERLAGYRRLEAFSPQDRPFQLGNSLSSLLLGRDQGDYYRALGVEVGWTSAPETRTFHNWRIYAERQFAVETNTDINLRRAFGGDGFRFNPTADEAKQFGVASALHLTSGLNPASWRGGLQVDGTLEMGTYRFFRPQAKAFFGVPLPGPLVGAVEMAGGTSIGDLPVQRRWYLGSPSTVRGIEPDLRLGGDTFWRGRGEIATAGPAVRLVGFSDFGWVGPQGDLSVNPNLMSVGVGVSLLDGLLRADFAHPIRGGSGWRLELYWGGPL